jgi:hypothetical protein
MICQPQWQEALIVDFSVAWPTTTLLTHSGKAGQSQEGPVFT